MVVVGRRCAIVFETKPGCGELILDFRGEELRVAVGFSNAQVPLVAIRMGLVASSVHFPAGHCPKGMGESKGDGLICAFYYTKLIPKPGLNRGPAK